MSQLHTKFKMSSFIHSKDTEGVPYVPCKIDTVRAQYDVIKMLGVKTNIIFDFLIPVVPIHYATFGKLS